MKNYLYQFEFFSGFYEDYFYKQITAKDEKDAIIQIVSNFKNLTDDDAKLFLSDELRKNWSVKSFWEKMDLRFFNGEEGYTLCWIKEIDFNLDTVGKYI